MLPAETAEIRDALEIPRSSWRDLPGFLGLLGGVVLPIAALGTELVFHFCKEVFFNPLPTFLHILLVALIPAANLWILLSPDRGLPLGVRWMAWMAWLNGGAIGVSAFYTLIFIPLLPIGAIAVIWFGLGFLILAPPLALIASMGLRRRLSGPAAGKPRGLWAGMSCAVGLLVLIEMPSTLTRLGMKWAASEEGPAHVRGVRLLRALGDKGMMLRLCYAWPSRATDLTGFLLSLGKPVGTEKARAVYYQVMGEAFSALPPPEKESRGFFASGDFDVERGGVSVAGMVPGLSLAASRLDASIDAQAALAYQEWTLEFSNEGESDAEARAQIELPPEGVVSRLTLWVDGEEREAAFASRGQVRLAYEKVVRARRDPVLVTTQGQDRVLMQCFPVPRGGKRMKVRLGITAPLSFSAAGEAYFHAPRFTERNFGTAAGHSLWLESTGPFPSLGEEWTQGNVEGTHSLRGSRSDAWLSLGQSWAVGGSSVNHMAWTEDSARLGKDFIQQFPESVARAPLGGLTLVVDGSRGMGPYLQGISGALRRSGRPVRIILAGNEELREFKGSAQEAGNWLERQPCVGGQDNAAALDRARELSSGDLQGSILWIAAGQPVLLASPASIRRGLERRSHGPDLRVLQVGNGPNRLLEELQGLPQVSSIRFSGKLEEELESLLANAPVTRMVLVRKRLARQAIQGAGKRTSDHLARLYAHERIGRLIAAGGEPARAEALALATAFRLVTPVSGAVVLENAAQYDQAGLQPGDPATVPGVPEPERIGLIVAVAAVLIAKMRPWRRWRKWRTMPLRNGRVAA